MDCVAFRSGIGLFNRQEFFEAHEVLEDVWRTAPLPERKFLQGFIQIAVAFHHYSTGNLVGAVSLLERGSRNLESYSPRFEGIELLVFLAELGSWRLALSDGVPPPPFPRLRLPEE